VLDRVDMQIDAWAAAMGFPMEAVFQLVLAAIAGGLVGMEREFRGRVAGFRTNLLVCLGSALTMIVSRDFVLRSWLVHPPAIGVHIDVDLSRIAAGVMTGVGFLGAGAIIQSQGAVRGLTTAAALWCVAAVGLTAGSGLYSVAIIATGLIVAALWLLTYIEAKIPKLRYRTVVVRRPWSAQCVAETIARFKAAKLDVVDAGFDRGKDLTMVDISLRIAFLNRHQYYTFERQIGTDKDFILVSAHEL